MSTIRSFEDLTAWQKARELSRKIYLASQEPPFGRDFSLRDQIRRAAVSVVSNIAEGFDRSGTAEFIQFLAIAKGSTGEVKAQLYLALDLQYISKESLNQLFALASETGRVIAGLMSYLRKTSFRGSKFRTRN